MSSGITVGMDLAEKKHTVCVLGADGEVLSRQTIAIARQR